MFKKRTDERGDTIVEVLIAIAVVSSVLAVTYSTMNRNLTLMQDNQERTMASKLAQGQVESLKSLWSTPDGKTSIINYRALGGFCINGTNVYATGTGTVTPTAATDNFSGYNVSCKNGIFRIGIRYNSTSKTYTVTVRWDRLGLNARNETALAYRLVE